MTAAKRELLDKAYLASINFAGKVCLEMFHNGPSTINLQGEVTCMTRNDPKAYSRLTISFSSPLASTTPLPFAWALVVTSAVQTWASA